MKTVDKIKDALDKVAASLGLNGKLLGRAQRRAKKFHEKAKHNLHERDKATKLADRYRQQGHLAKAQAETNKAARCEARRGQASGKAQFWTGRVKVLQQRINGLEHRQEDLKAELKKLSGVTIKGNKATGGTPRERLKAVALASAAACASGHRPNFYSMPGAWTVDHCITGEHSGDRSDCSQWFTSVYKAAGLKDPNGERYTGGYTGTLVANGKQVSSPQPGDAVIYGSGVGHHVELFIGDGRTIGHGSAPVDAGVVDLFGDGDYRFFSFV